MQKAMRKCRRPYAFRESLPGLILAVATILVHFAWSLRLILTNAQFAVIEPVTNLSVGGAFEIVCLGRELIII